MDFYKRKLEVQQRIKQMLEDRRSMDDICFLIGEKYGFSKKMVIPYIKTFAERGFLEIDSRDGKEYIAKNYMIREKKEDQPKEAEADTALSEEEANVLR